MSIVITRLKDVEKWSIEDQFNFYKKRFELQHCEEGCGREIRHAWGIYDDTLYCEICFEHIVDKNREEAKKQLEYHKREIQILEERFNL